MTENTIDCSAPAPAPARLPLRRAASDLGRPRFGTLPPRRAPLAPASTNKVDLRTAHDDDEFENIHPAAARAGKPAAKSAAAHTMPHRRTAMAAGALGKRTRTAPLIPTRRGRQQQQRLSSDARLLDAVVGRLVASAPRACAAAAQARPARGELLRRTPGPANVYVVSRVEELSAWSAPLVEFLVTVLYGCLDKGPDVYAGSATFAREPKLVLERYVPFVLGQMQVQHECALAGIVLLRRIMGGGARRITQSNVRRLWLAATMLATKMWIDIPFNNRAWALASRGLAVRDINCIELELLHMLDFNTNIDRREFARLQRLSFVGGDHAHLV